MRWRGEGRDQLFQRKGRTGGEGEQAFVPESLQEARSLAGRFFLTMLPLKTEN